jgi:hypothetical protein
MHYSPVERKVLDKTLRVHEDFEYELLPENVWKHRVPELDRFDLSEITGHYVVRPFPQHNRYPLLDAIVHRTRPDRFVCVYNTYRTYTTRVHHLRQRRPARVPHFTVLQQYV